MLVGVAGAASAADIYNKGGSLKDEPVYVAPTTWAGFYAGIHAGAGFDDELELSDRGRSETFDNDTGFFGGIQVGYNWQTSPNWVFGIEGSLSILADELADQDTAVSDYLATIRGRVGYAAGNGLFYGTAGMAFVGWADDVTEAITEDTTVGFVAGLGYEHKLTGNLSIGVEGLYYNFSTEAEIGDMGGANEVDVDRDFWTVQARLNYHFTSGYDDPLK